VIRNEFQKQMRTPM